MPSIREATVTLREGMAFEGSAGSGHVLTMDAAPRHGGEGRGFSPMELLLVGLGGCTGMDVVSVLRKMRQDITAYRIEVRGTRRDEYPQIYTEVTVEHVVGGRGLDPKAVARAVELSETRYCSVSAILAASATVRHTFRIEAADEEPG